jgi:hypothetical protein
VFPANVSVYLPSGVTINGTGALTFNGQIHAEAGTWYTGSGSVSVDVTAFQTFFSKLLVNRLGLNTTQPGAMIRMAGNLANPASMILEENSASGGGGTSVNFASGGTLRGSLGFPNNSANMSLSLFDTNRLVISHVTPSQAWMGIGGVPAHQLQLFADDAYKPGGGSWSNTASDARLKENVSEFQDGLAVVLQLTPKWYEYNGLGEMPHDGKRYVGLIAQDVETLLPYMIGHDTTRKLHPTDLQTTDFFTLSESALPYILLNAIKELTARVAALETATQRTAVGQTPAPTRASAKKAS